ncbi:MAG: rhodanese-like domain-containing protein [Lewinella sp.]|nr:rhodanese-like domain-containing protein [Lewinella sp.]
MITAGCQPTASSQSTDTPAAQATAQGAPFANLDVAGFRAKMNDNNVVILDVRTPQETAQGMIEGAIEINVTAPDFAQRVAELDKDKTYLVYCRSGRRSVTACNIMAEQGFSDLYNLLGGYLAWSR